MLSLSQVPHTITKNECGTMLLIPNYLSEQLNLLNAMTTKNTLIHSDCQTQPEKPCNIYERTHHRKKLANPRLYFQTISLQLLFQFFFKLVYKSDFVILVAWVNSTDQKVFPNSFFIDSSLRNEVPSS